MVKKTFIGHRIVKTVLTAILLLAMAVCCFTACKKETKDPSLLAPQMPYDLPGFTMLENTFGKSFNNGLKVLCCGRFSGTFLEDGSDKPIQDVLSIVVQNTGDSLVEYGAITLSAGKETAEFEFSGLPVGSAVMVQEKSGMTWSEGEKLSDIQCKSFALPAAIVLDFGSDFEIHTDDGVINVKNISATDFANDVSVFYKNFEYGLFLGGITYRARISGGIKAGQIVQSLQKHYWLDTSAILYMAYAE